VGGRKPQHAGEVLKHLAEVGSEVVQERMAANPDTPPQVLKRLVEVGNKEAQWSIVRSPSVILETL